MPEIKVNKYSPSEGYMYGIRTRELTLTRKAANQREFLLYKSEDKPMNEELIQIIQDIEADNEQELREALKGADVSDEAIDAAVAIGRLRSAHADEISGEAIAKALGVELTVEKADEEEEDEDEPISKSDLEALDPEIRDKVESLVEKSREREERVEKLEERLNERDRERRLEQWTAKAEEIENLSVDADDLAERLLKIEDNLGTDDAESVLESLRSADQMAKSELFEERGSSLGGSRSSDAYEEAVAKAESLMEQDPDLSRPQALDRVFKANRDLAKRYYDEMHS